MQKLNSCIPPFIICSRIPKQTQIKTGILFTVLMQQMVYWEKNEEGLQLEDFIKFGGTKTQTVPVTVPGIRLCITPFRAAVL